MGWFDQMFWYNFLTHIWSGFHYHSSAFHQILINKTIFFSGIDPVHLSSVNSGHLRVALANKVVNSLFENIFFFLSLFSSHLEQPQTPVKVTKESWVRIGRQQRLSAESQLTVDSLRIPSLDYRLVPSRNHLNRCQDCRCDYKNHWTFCHHHWGQKFPHLWYCCLCICSRSALSCRSPHPQKLFCPHHVHLSRDCHLASDSSWRSNHFRHKHFTLRRNCRRCSHSSNE